MAYLAYNGKFLTRMGKWLGAGSPAPVPTPTPLALGNVRFKFDDTSMTVQDLYDNIFDDYHCTVAQVLDANTGDPIPGLFDVRPSMLSDFKQSYKSGMGGSILSVGNCGGRVDLVDAYLSTSQSYFWQQAFAYSTAIRNITMTHWECVSGQTFTYIVDNSAAETLDLDYGNHSVSAQQSIGAVTSLDTVTLRDFTGTLPDNAFNYTTANTLNLYPHANTAVFDVRLSGPSISTVNIYTSQQQGTSYAFSTGTNSNLFRGFHLQELHAFGIDGTGNRTEIDLLLPSNCDSMFWGCDIRDLSTFHFDTTNLTICKSMFAGNRLCEAGIVDMYDLLSAKVTLLANYRNAFSSCGSDTVTGAAELAQIPTSWGGTMT